METTDEKQPQSVINALEARKKAHALAMEFMEQDKRESGLAAQRQRAAQDRFDRDVSRRKMRPSAEARELCVRIIVELMDGPKDMEVVHRGLERTSLVARRAFGTALSTLTRSWTLSRDPNDPAILCLNAERGLIQGSPLPPPVKNASVESDEGRSAIEGRSAARSSEESQSGSNHSEEPVSRSEQDPKQDPKQDLAKLQRENRAIQREVAELEERIRLYKLRMTRNEELIRGDPRVTNKYAILMCVKQRPRLYDNVYKYVVERDASVTRTIFKRLVSSLTRDKLVIQVVMQQPGELLYRHVQITELGRKTLMNEYEGMTLDT